MRWSASQYRRVYDELYENCDDDTQTKLDAFYDLLLDNGNLSGRPFSAPLEDGIFELRAKAARMLFYFGPSREIVFVHAIFKTTREVPRADIELAKKRRREIQRGTTTNPLAN